MTLMPAGGTARAGTVDVTSAGTLGANDFVDGSQFFPNPATPFAALNNPQSALSANGAAVGLSSTSDMFALQQGITWNGNFLGTPQNPGSAVIATGGDELTITFSNPVMGAGAHIQWALFGAFNATIEAFDVSDNLIASFTEAGNSTNAGDGSAIFLGLLDSKAEIKKIEYLIPSGLGIDTLGIAGTQSSATPLPAALPLFAAGLGVMAFLGRRRTRWAAAQAAA
jgi:hypothetical protein